MIHDSGGDGVGGDHDEIGGSAWASPVTVSSAIAKGDQLVAPTIARPPRDATSTHSSTSSSRRKPLRKASCHARSSTSPLPYGDQ